ncbi:Cytidylyltransferase family protein [Clavispora lusitaniae]|uniref:CTP-dependent diacylglycerol kinase n=1 Tax=Clavispora lusitaniae (strain ATCC 42720) TaxID=306902 RepID=C4Y862_CLAL4|nr:uncharacterized protein CLUG_04390 [Clavispora lusitaniae ATCC 42720]EEQ40262.1 hypothetical protein CLUG_04390 [Clavispora lusitaniae ATCC 42720]KAF5209765.1 hypothetical protein E0198_004076 [Clavispora lusitaniae]KAF7581797.1 Cytidylyltransferase family protein [Clavispora lusitaniae]
MDISTTPKAHKVSEIEVSSIRKRIITDLDSSYIEEEDATYVLSESSDQEEISDADFEEGEIFETEIVKEEDDLLSISEKETPRTLKEFLIENEVPRKLFHSFHGFLTLYLYCKGFSKEQIVAPLWTLFVIFFASDVIRFNCSKINQIIVNGSRFIMREKESTSWNGIVFYLAGLALVFTFAPKDISVMSVLLLSWADTAASTFGRQFGKYTPKIADGKSLAGSMASALMGIAACYLFYGYFVPYFPVNGPGEIMWTPETSTMNLHTYALVCGLAASISEAINIPGLDDNFTIPVLGSSMIYGVVWLFQKY